MVSEQALSDGDFLRARMTNRVVPNPPPRNANVSTESSIPDRIEAGYQTDGHKTWGFVIYRTSYESDADWNEFMRRLSWWTRDFMEYSNEQDVLGLMTWTVFDDRACFDGADTAAEQSEQSNGLDDTPQSKI